MVLAIRPEEVALWPAHGERPAHLSDVRNQWSGVVRSTFPAGPLVRVVVQLDCGDGARSAPEGEDELVCLVTRSSAEDLQIQPAVPVGVSVKAKAVHLVSAGEVISRTITQRNDQSERS